MMFSAKLCMSENMLKDILTYQPAAINHLYSKLTLKYSPALQCPSGHSGLWLVGSDIHAVMPEPRHEHPLPPQALLLPLLWEDGQRTHWCPLVLHPAWACWMAAVACPWKDSEIKRITIDYHLERTCDWIVSSLHRVKWKYPHRCVIVYQIFQLQEKMAERWDDTGFHARPMEEK